MDLINALEAWKTGKVDPDTGKPVSLLRVFLDEFNVTIKGANVSIITTEITVKSTAWTELKGAGYATRNTLAIQNKARDVDGLNSIFINGSNTAPVNYGMQVTEGNERIYDISQVPIYVRSKDGTVDFNITIEELS